MKADLHRDREDSIIIPMGSWDLDGNWFPDLTILDCWPVNNQAINNIIGGHSMKPHNAYSSGLYRCRVYVEKEEEKFTILSRLKRILRIK